MAPWCCTLIAQKRLEKVRYSVSRLRESFGSSAAVTPSRCSCHKNEPIKPSPAPVNLRFALWPSRELLRQTVWQFLPLTHILKLSDEELPFLTGTEDIEAALPRLFTGDVQLVLYTCGSKGAYAYTRAAHAFAPCQKVRAVDTTGAGDGFIGSFLWQLSRDGVTVDKLEKLSCKKLKEYLDFSNRFCGLSVQKHGAIDSYPTLPEMGL